MLKDLLLLGAIVGIIALFFAIWNFIQNRLDKSPKNPTAPGEQPKNRADEPK